MGPSTLFPAKPASRVRPADTAWPTPVELHCGECGYAVTARRELDHCPMCGTASWWAGVRGVVFGTSIADLLRFGWRQIDLPVHAMLASARPPSTLIL